VIAGYVDIDHSRRVNKSWAVGAGNCEWGGSMVWR